MIGIDPQPGPDGSRIKAIRRSTRSRHGGMVTPRIVNSLFRVFWQRLIRRGELRPLMEGKIPVLTTKEVRIEITPTSNDATPTTGSIRARDGYTNLHNVEWLAVVVDGNVRYIPLYD